MKRFLAMVAIPVAAMGAGVFATATPAQAAAPPSCVSVWVQNPRLVYITNNCGPEGSSQRVEVDWGWASPTSPCVTIAAFSGRYVSSISPVASYTELRSC